ncbi:MAG: serine/threonine protein kinase [Chloroflexia bacterium]|nr:serine/threonine protein kinase [Chloroflexia bacterium]
MSLVGKTLGSYHILEELGRSSVGSVYRGHNPQLDRYVAIKLLDASMTPTPEHIEQLLEELQPLTRLYHPHIVTLHAIGPKAAQCYIARDYIEGHTLAAQLEESGPLALDHALDILRQIAAALDYAHDRGVVHGDLRPTDILLDQHGRPFLSNLGLVPALERANPELQPLFRGEPHYSAPERAQSLAATPAGDLYSLGALLYQALTGRPAEGGLAQPGPNLPESVALVLGWAMAPAAAQRPHSAGELATLLRDAAAGQLSTAALEQIHQAIESALPTPSPEPTEPGPTEPPTEIDWPALEQEARAHEAAHRWAEAATAWRCLYALAWRQVYSDLRGIQSSTLPTATPVQRMPRRGREEERQRLTLLDIRPTYQVRHQLPGGDAPGILALAVSPSGEWLVTAGEAGYLWRHSIVHQQQEQRWQGHQGDVWGLALSPDGQVLASASEDGTVALWNANTMELQERLPQQQEPINALAFTPDSQHLVFGGDDGLVYLWDVRSGELVRSIMPGHSRPVFGLDISPDGRLIASVSEDCSAALWDLQSGRQVQSWTVEHSALNAVALSPDGALLAAGGEDCLVHLWNIAEGQPIRRFEGHEEQVTALGFSPDGSLLAAAASNGIVRLWSAWYGWDVGILERHNDWATALAFSADGSLLVSCSYDGSAWVYVLVEGGRL